MSSRESRGDRLRRYPPLGGALVSALIAVFVLPSALNIPQSNPTQTLEFAPIPPEDDDPPPPDPGNVQSLSLGSSSTAPAADADGGAGPGLPPPPLPDGVGVRPITKRCVGNPPRQTEDPMSPPCVGHFDGDNGGATHRGVNENEVRIVVYFDGKDGSSELTSRGSEPYPDQTWVDFDSAPAEDEFAFDRMVRVLTYHFNNRYQTYGRRVHVYGYHGNAVWTPESRRADAAETIRPHASTGRRTTPV